MKYRIFILSIVLSLLVFYTHLDIERVLGSEEPSGWLLTLLLFALMIGSQIIYRLKIWPKHWLPGRILVWVGAVTMGFWATFILLSMLVDFAYCIVIALQSLNIGLPLDSLQIQNLLHDTFIMVLILSAGFTLFGLLQAATGPKVKRVFLLPGYPRNSWG